MAVRLSFPISVILVVLEEVHLYRHLAAREQRYVQQIEMHQPEPIEREWAYRALVAQDGL